VRVLVAIPAKDEELTIGSIVTLCKEHGDVLVIDDGSSDRTARIAELCGAKVLRHETNMGKAKALKAAFTYALEHNYDILVCLDADGQHNPDDIPSLLELVVNDEADFVIGSRSRRGIPKYRVFGQKVLDVLTRFASGVNITDSQSGFRVLNRTALKCLKNFESNGYGIESEMIVYLAGKIRIKEKTINVRYDVPNKHKRNPFTHGMEVLNTIIGIIGYRRPLISFGLTGSILSIAGLAFGLWAFSTYYAIGKLPYGPSLASALLLILGLLMIVSGLILNSLVQIVKNSGKT